MKTIAVLFADGFEEIEAVTIVDVLRRAQHTALMVGVSGPRVTGSHQITVGMDMTLGDLNVSKLDGVVLPGGMPGAKNLAESHAVLSLLRQLDDKGKLIGAICAAPIVLHAAGLLSGKHVTCYPGVEGRLTGAKVSGKRVEIDGRIVTGKGPGASLEFSLKYLAELGRPEVAQQLAEAMILGEIAG